VSTTQIEFFRSNIHLKWCPTVNMPFIPTRLRLNEATISANDEDRPGINSLEEEKKTKSNFNFFVVVIIKQTLRVIHRIQSVHQLHWIPLEHITSIPVQHHRLEQLSHDIYAIHWVSQRLTKFKLRFTPFCFLVCLNQ